MQPPDPMFTKDTPKWEIIKWWAIVAPLAICWVCSIPFLYVYRYMHGQFKRKRLTYDEVVLALQYEDRYVTDVVEAFLQADGRDTWTRYTYLILPTWHPATKRVIVKTTYQSVSVSGSW